MSRNKILKLIAAVGVSELAGVVGSIFTSPSIPTWYRTLAKPEFNPPSWVFGPVWITLYALMGIALYMVWQKKPEAADTTALKTRKWAIRLFFVQLALNILWSIIFFGLHNLPGALVEIVVLWFAILATIISFSKVSKASAWLLVPYILWVSFATILTYSIWRLNS